MKIEKINDNQIRCTLTREDLENHQIRISELAYGTEKAKKLFRDMMQQAQIQFGFEADNIPLMIEAIPVSTESIILIITKVEDPEELDTRFSKFAPFRGNDKTDTLQLDGADNIIDIFQKLYEAKMKSTQTKDGKSAQNTGAKENDDTQVPDVNLIRLYEFDTLDDVIAAAILPVQTPCTKIRPMSFTNWYFTSHHFLRRILTGYVIFLRNMDRERLSLFQEKLI